MREDVKSLWLEDLRKNHHLHGKGAMENLETGKFCCLGRLGFLAATGELPSGVSGLVKRVPFHLVAAYPTEESDQRETCDCVVRLPSRFIDAVGLDHDVMCHLMKANDARETTDYHPAIKIIEERA